VGLFLLVAIWALLAIALAQAVPIWNSRLLEWLYYILAGLGWIFPAMPLIRWMSRSDAVPP
jgi:hypothetical protein